jgi:hypothetical protein
MRSSAMLTAACLAAAAGVPEGGPFQTGRAVLAGIVPGGNPEVAPGRTDRGSASADLAGEGERAEGAAGRAVRAPGAAVREVLWTLDSLHTIGGHAVTLAGAPRIVNTDLGPAVEFDGRGDGLFLDVNPLAGLERFTIEATFEPLPGGGEEQRFLHVQEAESEDRALLELRVLPDGRWCLDTYLRRDGVGLTLIDRTAAHPLGRWHVATLVYDGRTLAHYVDGRREAAGSLAFRPLGAGRTSIGVRQNRVSWFRGRIRAIRFVPDAVVPGAAPGEHAPVVVRHDPRPGGRPGGLLASGAEPLAVRSSADADRFWSDTSAGRFGSPVAPRCPPDPKDDRWPMGTAGPVEGPRAPSDRGSRQVATVSATGRVRQVEPWCGGGAILPWDAAAATPPRAPEACGASSGPRAFPGRCRRCQPWFGEPRGAR